MTTRIMVVLFVASLFSTPVLGQVAVEWGLLSKAEGDNLEHPYDKTNVTAKDYKVILGLPIPITVEETDGDEEVTFLISNSLFYSYKDLEVNNWPTYTRDSVGEYHLNLETTHDRLISFGYSATLMKKINDRWSGLAIAGFTYAGINPDEIKTEDTGIQCALGAMYSWKWEAKWSLGSGGYYSRLTGEDELLPLIIVKRETEDSVLDITIPSKINYMYKLDNTVSLGFSALLEGDMYSYVGAKVNQYDEDGNLVSTDNKIALAYSSLTIGPAVKVTLFETGALLIRSGISTFRRYQYWLPERKEVWRYPASADYVALTGHDYSGEPVEFPMKRTWFIKATLGIGI